VIAGSAIATPTAPTQQDSTINNRPHDAINAVAAAVFFTPIGRAVIAPDKKT
jgi:hypothetical protein